MTNRERRYLKSQKNTQWLCINSTITKEDLQEWGRQLNEASKNQFKTIFLVNKKFKDSNN